MPAQVQQVIMGEEYHFDTTLQITDIIRNSTISNTTMADIVVQPPSQIKTGQGLYPQTIAKQSVIYEPEAHYFATAVLLSEKGKVLDGQLDGTKAVAGFQLEESTSTSTLLFAFNDLAISKQGSYNIRLDIYKSGAAGATLVQQLKTSRITVTNGSVSPQQPCE